MFFCNSLLGIKYKNKEKESGSFLVNTINKQTTRLVDWDFPKSIYKRILLCTFRKRKKASITVEASMILPLFMFGMLCVVYLLEILAIQMAVKSGIYELAYRQSTENLSSVSTGVREMESQLLTFIGEANIESSIVVDGLEGFDLSASQFNYGTGVVELCVAYQVQLPVPRFTNLGLSYEEKIKFKR